MYIIDPYSEYSHIPENTVPKDQETSTRHITKEIVTASSRIFRAWGFDEYNPDDLVQKKGLHTYSEMRKDSQIKSIQQTKIKARLSTDYEIKAGDPDNALSVEMAEFVDYNLLNIKETFKVKLADIMTARDYGYSLSEKIFEIIATGRWTGKIGLRNIKTKEPFDYRFQIDKFRNVTGIIRDNVNQDIDGDLGTHANPYPLHKFILYSANKEFGNPYGQSDLREAYKPWWSKNFVLKFMNIYLERFGMPTLAAKYEDKHAKDKNLMNVIDNLLKNYQSKAGFRVPEGVTLELLEAKRKGEGGYIAAIDKYDVMMARALLMPDMAAQGGSGGGSYALSRERFALFVLVLDEMGDDIENAVVDDQIIEQLILFNYGIVDNDLKPKFKFESIHEDNVEVKAKIIDILVKAGIVNPNEEWVRDYTNIPDKPQEIKDKEAADKTLADKQVQDALKKEEEERREREGRKISGNVPSATAKDIEKAKAMHLDFELTREPTVYEVKVDFPDLDKQAQSYEEHLTEDLLDVVLKWRSQIIKQSESILKNNDNKAINKMTLRNVGDFKNILRNWMVKIDLDNKFRESQVLINGEVPLQLEKKKIPKAVAFAHIIEYASAPEFDPWMPMPTAQALEFMRTKRIVRKVQEDGSRTELVLGTTKEMAYYEDTAFAISGIESTHILNQSKMILFDAIATGDAKTATVNLENLFDRYIDKGSISANLTTPNRLNTIVRNNVNTAQNRGREMYYKDPEIADFIPFVQVSAILDSRTTDYCAGLDGKVFKKTDAPTFPAHHNCRTHTVPITTFEANKTPPTVSSLADEEADLRTTGKQSAVRGVGFGGTPIVKV